MFNKDLIQERREELAKHLEAYLNSQGIIPNASGLINCISPYHNDSNASMRILMPHKQALYCYGCGASYDIFDAAHIIENKPLDGKAFLTENVNYLSQMFGYDPIEIELTPEEENELLCERAHRMAGAIFRQFITFDQAKSRGWKDERVLKELGIGTIIDLNGFFTKLCKETNMTLDELRELGIEQRFFGPSTITFTLSNDKGICIGFASRDMEFEVKKAKGEKCAKYINASHQRNPLYKKSSYVYNIHRSKNKKNAPITILTEGYADVVALENNDIRGGVAIGGTAISDDHIQTLLKAGVNDIVLAQDCDANLSGQDSILKSITLLRNYPQIRTRVIDWSKLQNYKVDGKLDIDTLLHKAGKSVTLDAINNAVAPIIFKIRELKARKYTQKQIAEEIILDIASVSDELMVQEYTYTLAEETDYDFDLLLDKVKRERRARNRDVIEELDSVKKKLDREYNKAGDVTTKIDILQSMAERAKNYDSRGKAVSLEKDMAFIDLTEQESDGLIYSSTANTGLEELDKDLGGGLPLNGKLILIGGRPHVGKTQMQQRLAMNVLDRNPDVDVLVYTIDDDARSWLQRVWAGLSGLPIYKCQRPNEYMRDNPRELAMYIAARNKVKNWIKEGRLTIRDASIGNNISALENIVHEKKSKTNRSLIVFFDNIHKTSGSSNRENLEDASNRTKHLGQKLGVTIVVNAELRKRSQEGTEFPKPPTEDDLKETGKLHYDADYILLIDSPMQRMPYRPEIINPKNGMPYKSYKDIPAGHWNKSTSNVDLPVIHALRLKNKIFNITGEVEKTFKFNFDPSTVQFLTRPPENSLGGVTDVELSKENVL